MRSKTSCGGSTTRYRIFQTANRKGSRRWNFAGGIVPQRDQQFEIIEALKKHYFDEKNPVFSLETKKKELLESFYRNGRAYSQESFLAFDQDFPSWSSGKIGHQHPSGTQRNMFTYAIVCKPSNSITDGITTANLGVPDYEKAHRQHQAYLDALRKCGLTVITLPANEAFPDSCFVEDTALLTKRCAIIARPGAARRQGEEAAVREMLPQYFDNIESIQAPGTIEPGDIMMVGDHFYIGFSDRTNAEGARQMISILKSYDLSGYTVQMQGMLHLKTGLSYLEHNTLVGCGEILNEREFEKFNHIVIDADEAYAANCVWVNGTVLVAAGFPKTRKKIEAAGYPVIPVDVSEFQKLDGGLSCLSLRF